MKWFKKLFRMDQGPYVFAKANPAHPHGGLDRFSETNVWPLSIRVDGISLEGARRELCGKVIDWTRLSKPQMLDMERARLRITHEELKGLFR